MSFILTLLPCLAQAASPYKVGVLYDSDEAVVTQWKSASESAKTPIDLAGISYAVAIAEPEKLLTFNCLVLPDSPKVPAPLQPALGKFAHGGGDLILAGGRAFSQLTADQTPFTDLAFEPQSRFQFNGEFSVRPWSKANVDLPYRGSWLLPQKTHLSGCSALGFAFPGQSEFHPLLEVIDV